MSRAIPYTITIRDPEAPGAPAGEHEVVFRNQVIDQKTSSTVLRLSTDELRDLGVAVLERLGVFAVEGEIERGDAARRERGGP